MWRRARGRQAQKTCAAQGLLALSSTAAEPVRTAAAPQQHHGSTTDTPSKGKNAQSELLVSSLGLQAGGWVC